MNFATLPLTATLLLFLLSAVVVGVAGTRLAREGDVIAARTRLGGLWFGSVFLALATSLPELATSISAARIGAVDIAAGNLFGSSMANMLVLALLTLLPSGRGLFSRAALDQVMGASLAILLNCLAGAFVLARLPVSVAGVGAGSAVLLMTYLLGTRLLYRHSQLARERVAVAESASPQPRDEERPVRSAIAGFMVAAAVITAAAPVFARSAERIADITGISQTLVGTWLVGLSTSLPELVTCLAALRLGAADLAVGNLFGSNAVNMVMFVPLDLAHRAAPVLGAISPSHAISAFGGIALMATSLIAIIYRAHGRATMRERSGVVMIIVYVLGMLLLGTQS